VGVVHYVSNGLAVTGIGYKNIPNFRKKIRDKCDGIFGL
jgi:hypothetical protein